MEENADVPVPPTTVGAYGDTENTSVHSQAGEPSFFDNASFEETGFQGSRYTQVGGHRDPTCESRTDNRKQYGTNDYDLKKKSKVKNRRKHIAPSYQPN